MNQDPITKLIEQETNRQYSQINLIASENIASLAVHQAVGSALMHKYAEGNIGKRYYQGNQFIDQIEQLAIDRARELFQVPPEWDANVQALSGSYANLAAITAVLNPGDTILSMYLPDGGHLSHGWSYNPGQAPAHSDPVYKPGEQKIHLVSKLFNIVQYKTDPQTHLLNYAKLAEIALEYKPQLIITGGTAYSRNIDYRLVKQIANSVGAIYLADIAHEAGLIAAGVLPSPVGIADIVTMTTHKTLRAARGAIILAKQDIITKVNRAVLPGLQGGPFINNIAGIAVGLHEALQPEFKQYAHQVIKNAHALAQALMDKGYQIVTAGTDKHLFLIDLSNKAISGKRAALALEQAGIIVNMNTIPGEQRSPNDPSGIRIGTPLVTTVGMGIAEMEKIALWIHQVLTLPIYQDLSLNEFRQLIATNASLADIKRQVVAWMEKYSRLK